MLGYMTINVYKTSADNKALDKITGATSKSTYTTIDTQHDNSVLRPIFIVSSDSALFTANYLYCAAYGRYYYIDNIEILTGRRVALHCRVDVLQTYASAIKARTATIVRYEKIKGGTGAPTKYIDSKLPVYPSKNNLTSIIMTSNIDTTIFPPAYCYLLTTIGGAPTIPTE